MQEKLKWNAIGLARNTHLLRDFIQKEKSAIPVDHTSKQAIRQFIYEKKLKNSKVNKFDLLSHY